VPLSEEELRLLEQMERALVEEDPKFASTLRGTSLRSMARRRAILAGVCFVVGIALDLALIPFFGASGAAAAASGAYLAGGLSAVLIYRRRMSFRLRELVIPRSGDFDALRALAPTQINSASLRRREAS